MALLSLSKNVSKTTHTYLLMHIDVTLFECKLIEKLFCGKLLLNIHTYTYICVSVLRNTNTFDYWLSCVMAKQ